MDKLKTRVLFISLIILALVSISAVAAADSDDIINANQDDFDLSEETVSDVEDTQEPILADDSQQQATVLADDPEPEQQENLDGSSYVTVKFSYINASSNGPVEFTYKENYQIKNGKNLTINYAQTFYKYVNYNTRFQYDGLYYNFTNNWTNDLTGEIIERNQNQVLLPTGKNYTVTYTALFNTVPLTHVNVTWIMKDSNGNDVIVNEDPYTLWPGEYKFISKNNFTNFNQSYPDMF
jgi:hypothetical protein